MTEEERITDLQQAIDGQGHTWKAGPTSLSELSREEQARRLGLRLDPSEVAKVVSQMAEAAPRTGQFPIGWDWRDVDGTDWTTPVRDQQGCGSCVAFGTVAVLESMLKRHQNDANLQVDLSEAYLFFCGCGDCCDVGWWPTDALDFAQSTGVPDEACFPYRDQDTPCSNACQDWQGRAIRVVGWRELADVTGRKEWLSSTGPVVGCMAVYRDFFSYVGGVYRHSSGSLSGYHAVGVVGYSEEEQAWICKNSWGSNWGEAGWFKIGYGECGIDTQFAMYAVEAVTPSPSPPPPPPPPPPPDPEPGCNVAARLLNALRGG
ncbi:C1 family peptidase [Chloroflexota bacterium]